MRYLILILAMVLPAMAGREFVAASSQLGITDVPVISIPFTISAHAWRDSGAVAAVALNTTTNADERCQIFWDSGSSTWRGFIGPSVGGQVVTNTTSSTANVWEHVAMTVTSTANRSLFVKGSKASSPSLSSSGDGFNQVVLGARKSTTFGGFWNGGLAEVAVWAVVLTDSEIASLASGAAPFMIRPGSLVFYATLTGRETATEWNYVGTPVSLTNSPAAGTTHPRIYRP